MNVGFRVTKSSFLQLSICAVAFYGLFCSWQQFTVGNSYYRVKNNLDTWQKSPSLANESLAQNMLKEISSAIEIFPDNALYYQLRAQTSEWLVFAQSNEMSSEKVELLNAASKDYKKSLELRPTWSGSWIGLATIKWKLSSLDEEFYFYLKRAEEFGPQDSLTHIFYSEFGLNMFSLRSMHFVRVKAQLKKHIHLGLLNTLSRNAVLKSISNHDAKQVVCVWLKKHPNSSSRKILGCVETV
ncbi:VpsP family polysaccharide biosynthesis protein [Alteromonas sp.]|uniref:VpsP family polysaccharide biosynthesis protein n=1 Tax=Alteromonas sp. TaxID=232 RepID=UPI00257A269E|nr:VpsP family polysaccharide biosynthesis protein [Alteromonas sp.]NQY16997.1 hypothetical protein [Alteromonas sp.]